MLKMLNLARLALTLAALGGCSTPPQPPPALDVELRPFEGKRSTLRFQIGDGPTRALVPGKGVGAIQLRRWTDDEGDKLSVRWERSDGTPIDVLFGFYTTPLRYTDPHDAPGEPVPATIKGWVLQLDGRAEPIQALPH